MHTSYHKSDQCNTLGVLSDKQHASLTFKGNKNRKGQTLGSMSDNRTDDCNVTVKSNIKAMPEDNPLPLVPQSISLSSENVLRQGISYGTDNTDTFYQNQVQSDVAGVPVWDMAYTNPSNVYKRKKSIPDTVVYNKYQSVGFKNCLNQNRKGLALSPIMI